MSPVGKRKKRVGLALSGGAARGIAHVGVLDVLHKAGIPIDMIAGTSAGAIMGALYAAQMRTDLMVEYSLDPRWKTFNIMGDPTLGRSGFLKGHKIEKLISGFLGGDYDFNDLKIPFSAVATDIDTGEEIIINSGKVMDAIRASISLPGIFTIVKREGRFLVDGGLTTPVPIHVVRDMGADFVIAVCVSPGVSRRIGSSYKMRAVAHKEPNIFQILMQSFYITTWTLAHTSLRSADVVIEPEIDHITSSDFRLAPELVAQGQKAAEKALPEIRKKLEEL
jgi:NTE family protein